MNILENLRYHLIDDEFFKIFQHIIKVQTIMGNARISVNNKYISTTTILQKIYSMSLLFVTLLVYDYKLCFGVYFQYKTPSSTLDFLILGQHIVISINFIIRSISNSFMYSYKNVKLYVTMQKLDRNMKINILDGKYEEMYKKNLASIILVLSIYSLSLIWYCDLFGWVALVFIVFVIEEIELLSFLSIVRFLHFRLKYVNDLIDIKTKVKWQKYIRENRENCSYYDIWNGFHNLAVAYYLLQKLYGIFVSKTFLFQFDDALRISLKNNLFSGIFVIYLFIHCLLNSHTGFNRNWNCK